MREIKFRAWDKLDKKMVTDSMKLCLRVLDLEVLDPIPDNNPIGFPYNVYHDFEIMQYTGLNDLNGTEIYEGDIVHHSNTRGYDNLAVGVVEYEEHRAQFRHSRYSEEYLSGSVLEVIGNIYENPELLEGSDHYEQNA